MHLASNKQSTVFTAHYFSQHPRNNLTVQQRNVPKIIIAMR